MKLNPSNRQAGKSSFPPKKINPFSPLTVAITNRQRLKKISSRRLKQIVSELFVELKISKAELGINLVDTREMARVNETFLQHAGSTDVITFDYLDWESQPPKPERQIYGELFICVADACAQAKEFRTSWQAEIIRYTVHGILHLLGYDDLKPHLRRAMKREENRLVRSITVKL